MPKLYKKFTFKDHNNQQKEVKVHKNDLRNFKINLLEASLISKISDVYMYDDKEREWKLLDYYNDV